MYSVILLILGIFFYIYFYKKTRNVMNPIGVLLAVWCLSAAFSAIRLTSIFAEWEFVTFLVVVVTAFTIFLVGRIYIKKARLYNVKVNANGKTTNKIIVNNKVFKYISRFIFIIALICFLIEWSMSNFNIAFFASGGDKKASVTAISGIHYGSILLPYCAMYSFYELLFCKGPKIYNWFVILFVTVVYAFFILMSRGMLLNIILGCFYIFTVKNKISFKGLFIVLCIVGIGFVLMADLRISSTSSSQSLDLTDNALLQFFAPAYIYVGTGFQNLQSLILSDNGLHFFNYTFKFLYDLFGLRAQNTLISFEVAGYLNSTTFIYPFYHDLKIFGVIIFVALLTVVICKIYTLSTKNSIYLLLLAVLQKPIICCFFGNYFFIDNVDIWPILITFLLCLMSSQRFAIKEKRDYKICVNK